MIKINFQERYFNINNKKIYCKYNNNHHSPTVIFEAGLADNSKTFKNIQSEISKCFSTLSYDRAGLGKSKGDIKTRSGLELVSDFNMLLKKAPVGPPYILVSHSFGTLISRLFASIYPNQIVGMLLIDPSPENKEKYFNKILQNELKEKMTNYFNNPKLNGEKIDKVKTYKEVKKHNKEFDFPLTIISRGLPNCYGENWPEQKMLEIEQSLQVEIKNIAKDNRMITAEKSGHFIHIDQPELVIEEIKNLIEKIKQALFTKVF
ncbi:MAG: alpha/beta fold hydrolase [Bacillota bacterium]